jgi:copper chaperone CopZ
VLALVVALALVWLALKMFERQRSLPAGRGVPPARAVLDSVALQIGGMESPADALTVQAALQRTAGVAGVQVDFASGQARITYDPNRTDPDRLIATVHQAGFQASR